MAETMTLQGGCLCGRIRYEVRPESDEGYYRHCRMCQLAFGNTRAAFINVPQAALPAAHRGSRSCTPCRSLRGAVSARIAARRSRSPTSIRSASISRSAASTSPRVRPVSHFATESRVANWHAEDGLPGERLDASERLAKRWKDAYGDAVVPGVGAVRSR